jgi:uncharacterized protein YbjT (DUF2867 family)
MIQSKIRVIITGATGMVGEGVAYECMQHPGVESILLLNRKPSGIVHPKVTELLHDNFYDVTAVREQLRGFDACFFCLGISSVGASEEVYRKVTYELTMHVARVLAELNPGMTFCYVSGSGTDSTVKGSLMWARVKGQTENHLLALPFRQAYMFRPGYMQPTKGLKNALKYYRYLGWLYPVFKKLFPGFVGTLQDLGRAMIGVTTRGYSKRRLEVKDINLVAAEETKLLTTFQMPSSAS